MTQGEDHGQDPDQARPTAHGVSPSEARTNTHTDSLPLHFQTEILARLNIGVTVWHLPDPDDAVSLRFVATNAMGERLMGSTAEERADKRMIDLYEPEVVRPLAELYREVMRTGQALDLGDVRYDLDSGQTVWLRVRVVRLSDWHVASLYSDVTDHVAAVDALAARTDALERSNRELEEFASVVSHDLREPLRKVTAFGDRLAQRASLDERSADYLRRMTSAALRMQQLIDDLLTYGRVRARAQVFVARDLAAIVRGVLTDLEVAIEESAAQVEVGPLPQVYGDPTQLRQLFQNLIGNALKFRRAGVAPHVQVQGSEDAPDGFVRIVVRDNGIGFEPRFASQIFGVFQRLHSRSTYEGSGMGLSVCKRIVEGHGGQILAEATLGSGATFIVDLPAQPSTPDEHRAA